MLTPVHDEVELKVEDDDKLYDSFGEEELGKGKPVPFDELEVKDHVEFVVEGGKVEEI